MKEKKLKNLIWFISVILGSTISILIVLQVSLFKEVNNYRKLSKADQYFLLEEYDSAWNIYDELVLDYFPDTLLDSRNRLQQLKSATFTSDFLSDSMRLELLTKLQGCMLFAKQQKKLQEISDTEILQGMMDCYLQKSNKLITKQNIVEEIENTGFLIFKNSNGNDVYYLGEMEDSIAHGSGFGLFSNESYYRGYWENNMRHGEGRFETRRGEVYIGTYKNDKRNGYGTYWFRNGDYYKGEWKDSKRHGIGTVFSAQGNTIVHGFWEADRLNRRESRRLLEE